MNDSPLRIPQAGDRVSATQLARVVRAVKANRLLPSPGVRFSRGPNGTHLIIEAPKGKPSAARPLPYEVRFDGSLNDGGGGWKIYLPTSHLLLVAGENISTGTFGGISVIQDGAGNDTPWYILDDVSLSANHVWLTVEDGDAALNSEPSQDGTSVCIAEVSYDAGENEGDPITVSVRQSVVGAITLGSETPPPSTADRGCWKIVSTTRLNNEDVEETVHVFANQFYSTGEIILDELALTDVIEDHMATTPFVALKISATTGSQGGESLVWYETFAAMQADMLNFSHCVNPLYMFDADAEDMKILVDFRNVPEFQFTEPLPSAGGAS